MTTNQMLADFLRNRNINKDVAEQEFLIQIRLIHGEWMIVSPYIKDSVEVGYKARSVDKSKFFSTPDRDLFNIDVVAKFDHRPIILTEGEWDCISIYLTGHCRVVSLPNGWSEKSEITNQLDSLIPFLKEEQEIVIAGDNDRAGESLPHAVYRFMWEICNNPNVKYCVWPKDCKDANDVLVKYGVKELRKCIENAKQIDPPGGINHGIMDPPPMPQRKRLMTGTFLDDVVPFETRELSVCTGYPGSGKSHMALFAAVHTAKENDVNVGIINMETDPYRLRDQAFRMVTKGQSYEDATFQTRQNHMDKINWLNKHIRIVTPEDGHTIEVKTGNNEKVEVEVEHRRDWLIQNLWALVRHHKCKFIYIDPWNVIQHNVSDGETMTQYCNDVLSDIRKIADQGDAHICVLAHPTKVQDLSIPPTGHKVADSAAFFNKPGLGWTVHYYVDPAGTEDCLVMNWKIRNSTSAKNREGKQIRKGWSMDMWLDEHTQLYHPTDPNKD